LHGNVIGSLKTTLPLLMPELHKAGVNCIAFPDDGAAKRFAYMFAEQGFEIITCGKVARTGRVVVYVDTYSRGMGFMGIIFVDSV